jgi:hypothetical protein
MLALHGFDAFGLEVSPKAVETARDYAEKELAKPSAHNFADQDDKRLTGAAKGTVTFVCGDFFQDDWEAGCFSAGEPRGFDLIYDYTVSSLDSFRFAPSSSSRSGSAVAVLILFTNSSYALCCPRCERTGHEG